MFHFAICNLPAIGQIFLSPPLTQQPLSHFLTLQLWPLQVAHLAVCLLPDVFHLACPPLCESVSFPFERMNYFFFQHLGFFYLSRYEFICKHRFETLNTTVLNNDPGVARLGNRFEEPAELLSLLHSPTSTHRVQFSHIPFPLFASMTTLSPFFFSHYRKR